MKDKVIDGEIYLSQSEVARQRGVYASTVLNWRKTMGLKARRIGGRWFISKKVFEEWEAGRQ